MIYDDDQWVSYLTDEEYDSRMKKWHSLGFGGISDWAADLDKDWGDDGKALQSADGDSAADPPACDWAKSYNNLENLSKDAPGMSAICAQYYALKVLNKMVGDVQNRYNDINSGYDDKFQAYIRYIKDIAPAGIDGYMIAKDGSMGEGTQCKSYPAGHPNHVVCSKSLTRT